MGVGEQYCYEILTIQCIRQHKYANILPLKRHNGTFIHHIQKLVIDHAQKCKDLHITIGHNWCASSWAWLASV